MARSTSAPRPSPWSAPWSAPRPRGVSVVATQIIFIVVVFVGACRRPPSTDTRVVTFRGEEVATVIERAEPGHVRRETSFDGDRIVLDATIDRLGFVQAATSTRSRGPRTVRAVRLRPGAIESLSGADVSGILRLPERPVILLELLHRLRVEHTLDATLVDLAAAEVLNVRLKRQGPALVVLDDQGFVVARALPEGARIGPGAFAEGDAPPALSSPPVEVGLPGETTVRGHALRRVTQLFPPRFRTSAPHEAVLPEPFVESSAPAIVAFATPRCGKSPLEAARKVAEAVFPLVDPARSDEPPSAQSMLLHGGDCDGAAALVVASLRACGIPARPVVGYRLVDPGASRARLVPHAIAEVYTTSGWVGVDATVPALGSLDDVFLPVAIGLGGALSMGRLLGVVESADFVATNLVVPRPEHD
jgi:hypothetical protein